MSLADLSQGRIAGDRRSPAAAERLKTARLIRVVNRAAADAPVVRTGAFPGPRNAAKHIPLGWGGVRVPIGRVRFTDCNCEFVEARPASREIHNTMCLLRKNDSAHAKACAVWRRGFYELIRNCAVQDHDDVTLSKEVIRIDKLQCH